LDLVVVGPAVPAIEIAFVLDKKVRRDGMKVAWQHPRANIREQPSTHRAINEGQSPIALLGRCLGSGVFQLFGILRKYWLRECQPPWSRNLDRLRRRVH